MASFRRTTESVVRGCRTPRGRKPCCRSRIDTTRVASLAAKRAGGLSCRVPLDLSPRWKGKVGSTPVSPTLYIPLVFPPTGDAPGNQRPAAREASTCSSSERATNTRRPGRFAYDALKE